MNFADLSITGAKTTYRDKWSTHTKRYLEPWWLAGSCSKSIKNYIPRLVRLKSKVFLGVLTSGCSSVDFRLTTGTELKAG